MPDEPPLDYLSRPAGAKLAFRRRGGDEGAPALLWLGGFKSDMSGTKATALDTYARARGFSYVRFDYSGHGESGGTFAEGTISRWLADSLEVLDSLTQGPQILVGSSMGAWIALHMATARPELVQGLVLIAPAADFTARLMWPRFDNEMRARLNRGETIHLPDAYGDGPTPISPEFMADGARMSLLDAPIPYHGPVRILQGMEDPDVPWSHAVDTAGALASLDVAITLIKDGDHRLSSETDLVRLFMTIDEIAEGLEDLPDNSEIRA